MKVELIEQINIVLNWVLDDNKETTIKNKVIDVLEKHRISWSVSEQRMTKKLNRISIANLKIVRDELVEAIY